MQHREQLSENQSRQNPGILLWNTRRKTKKISISLPLLIGNRKVIGETHQKDIKKAQKAKQRK